LGFVVALNRDRDSYQVPRALAEVGQLEQFVTDYYVGASRLAVPSLGHRTAPEIAPGLVTPSLQAFLAQLPYELGRRFRPVDFPSAFVESALGRTAARVAAQHPDADLLLYSGSAKAAFEGPSRGRRILFQYHPSPAFIERTVTEIDELGQVRPWTQEAEVNSPSMEAVHRAEVALAERALCASSFTRAGLEAEGMDRSRIAVVPYGCPAPTTEQAPEPTAECRFLYVGQGVARKGLHLLIEAWRRAELEGATLTIVASRLDPQMAAFAEGVPRLTVRGRVPRAELDALMRGADTLVLPSLVEGFGLVLGEALASGSRLIASTNTGLVDMGLPPQIGRVVEAGRVDPLVDALRDSVATYTPDRPYRHTALAEADRLSWSAFRAGIRTAVGL
jgi:glycosyltransferase involved in cell wall biosynthesis